MLLLTSLPLCLWTLTLQECTVSVRSVVFVELLLMGLADFEPRLVYDSIYRAFVIQAFRSVSVLSYRRNLEPVRLS